MTYQERALGNRKDDEPYTIFVNNLPAELNEDGIAQIFKTYGEICSLFTPSNAQWAYISYKTYKEAEHAIRSLNEQSPLYLTVAFRKKATTPVNKNAPLPQENGGPIDQRDYRYIENRVSPDMDPRRPKIMPQALAMNMAEIYHNPNMEVESVYPTELDHNVYNPFESRGRYADTNAMWSRGCVTIDGYGKRNVSRGRGYTNYPVSEPAYAPIHNPFGRVYEKREPGYYQYGNDGLEHGIGKCQFCAHSAKHRCGRCEAYYCSQQCQFRDWPRHKLECVQIPPLIAASSPTSPHAPQIVEIVSHDEPTPIPRKPRGMMDAGMIGTLRRPKKLGTVKNPVGQSSEEHEKVAQVVNNSNGGTQLENSLPEANSIPKIVPESPKHDGNRKVVKEQQFEGVDDKKEISSPVKVVETNIRANLPSEKRSGNVASVKSPNCSVSSLKMDYEKTERDLAFQKDPRLPTKVNNQPLPPRVNDSSTSLENLHVERLKIGSSIEKPKIMSPISREKFEAVRVVFIAADATFWVNKIEDVPKLESMMLELSSKALHYPKVENVVVGQIYAVQYEGIWHRAVVVSKAPTIISYIDFGNEEPPQSNDFRLLKDFADRPGYAINLRLSANSKVKNPAEEEVLSVKMVGIDEQGVIEVIDHEETILPKTQTSSSQPQVVPEANPEPSKISEPVGVRAAEKSTRNLPSSLDNLQVNGAGFLQVFVSLDDRSYAASVLSNESMSGYEMVYDTLTNVCNQSEKPKNFCPKIGSFVCGKRDDAWLRGHVVALGPPVRLALVDEARVAPVEEVTPMPSGYEDIYTFGSIVILENANAKFNPGETGQFEITEITHEGDARIVKGILSVPEHMKGTRFTMKNWIPTAEQKGIALAELKNNSEVCISAYRSERILYVRTLDNESLERYQRITQNIAKWAQKAPKLEKPPVVGQLVIAKFVDENYYRAIVTKVLDDKIGVSYVDFGNDELTTIDQLRVLSDELKDQKSCASKIVLKGITEGVPTKEVHQYLDLLVGTEQPLICTFEGIPSKDGVTLTTANGESVNEKVNTYLKPNWQREDPSKNLDCFMLDDLEMVSLGEIGHTVKVLVLYAPEPPFKYVMAPLDRELIAHVTGIMPGLLEKYCTSAGTHYIPRDSELCLAIWEGAWYRGVCLNRSATPSQALIYFVDYGNTATVNHTDIRQMTKDFMSPSALGLSCVVKNLGIPMVNGKVPENVLRRIEQLVPVSDLVDAKILRKASTDDSVQLDGDYEIELPSVRDQLVAEGLAK